MPRAWRCAAAAGIHASGDSPLRCQIAEADGERLQLARVLFGLLVPEECWHDYEATEYLRLIDTHRKRYTLFSGLSHKDQTGRQPHNSEITWLTAARRPGLDGFRNTISLDQVAANHLGYATRFPSIVLGTATPQSQSYTSSGAMVPSETSPANLFKKLFLQGTSQEVAREVQSLNDGGSILDRVKSQTASLRRRISATDRWKLDAYLDAVRTAERELADVKAWQRKPKPVVDQVPPTDILNSADLIGRIKGMFRMIPMILETDSSRVVSLMIQDHAVVPKLDGVTADQHSLSHHGQDEAKIAQLKKIELEIVKAFGGLLTRLGERSDVKRRAHRPDNGLVRQQPRQRQRAHDAPPANSRRRRRLPSR